jgi:hypothetical protein
MPSLNFSNPADISVYFSANATRDPEVIRALLGRTPHHSDETVMHLNLGLVTGSDLGEMGRFDTNIDPGHKFRVLVPDISSEIDVACFTGLNPQEIELLREYALEGIATWGVEQQLGFPEPVGVGLIHVLKPGIPYELIDFEDRETHPNGREASIRSALETRRRFLERLSVPSPERR